MCMTAWVKMYEEDKQRRKLEDAMGGADGKFKSLQSRQLANASGVQSRVNEQMKQNLLTKCLCWWQIEARVNSVERHYGVKLESERKQINSIQSISKTFFQQLEAGLGADGDSSGRGSTHSR